MKNIWIFFQDGGTPKQGWGERHYFLANEFIQHGYRATIFAGNNCHLYTNPVKFKGQYLYEDMDGLQYCWIKVPGYRKSMSVKRILSWFMFALKLFFVSRKKVGRPDVIIVSSIPLFPIVPALIYKLFFRCKVIFEVRDIWPLSVIQVGSISKYHPFVAFLRMLELLAYRQADHLVSVLQFANKHIEKSVRKKVDFTWISNGFSMSYFLKKSGDEYPSEFSLEHLSDKFIVGYAGTMGAANANNFLIESAKLLSSEKNIHFVLIGDGPEKETLMESAAGLENVTFISKVPKAAVQSIIKKFNVGYIGSRHLDIYQYGIAANKLFDYMIAGLPVIISSQFTNNIVSMADCGLTVMPESGSEIVNAIQTLYRMPDEQRIALGEKGRKFAEENFLYENLAKKYIALFNK